MNCCFFNELLNILSIVWHKIYQIVVSPSLLESYSNVLSNIVLGVIAIMGFRYLKPLKDKTVAATFNFWSQLRVRLITIKKWLKQDCGLIDNLYSPDSKKEFSSLTPEISRIREFKNKVEQTLKFVEDSNDQMPAYKGWSDDYLEIIAFLQDTIIYDICNHEQFFKFTEPITDKQRKEYADSICIVIDRLCNKIKNKQTDIERRICKK